MGILFFSSSLKLFRYGNHKELLLADNPVRRGNPLWLPLLVVALTILSFSKSQWFEL